MALRQVLKNRLLDQWKSLVSDVGNIGTRYATANGFYLSVITALLALLAYVGTGKVFEAATYPVIVLVAASSPLPTMARGELIAK